MDSLRIFDVIYATTLGGPNDATTNLQIMAYQYSFQWYQMGKGMAQAIVLLLLVVMVSYLLMRLWNRAVGEHGLMATGGPYSYQRTVRYVARRGGGGRAARLDCLSVRLDPADVVEEPGGHHRGAADVRLHADDGQLRGAGDRGATRAVLLDPPGFSAFFLNSMIISFGAVALSVAAGIPAAYALARFNFPFKNTLAFVLMSFRFVPFIAFVIPLYILYQRFGLYNTHAGLILAYQLITLPFTIWMLRSFFMEIPLEIQEAAKIDGCSWLGVLGRVILPLSMPGIAVTVILGFMFCWNAFNYPLMLAGRQTFPVTVGAIQFISYEQVLWGQMAAATIVAAVPQLLLSLMVQKYIVRGLTMGAVK